MLSEMCDVDPVSYKCGVALSLSINETGACGHQ